MITGESLITMWESHVGVVSTNDGSETWWR
jgi:hypothetical protein